MNLQETGIKAAKKFLLRTSEILDEQGEWLLVRDEDGLAVVKVDVSEDGFMEFKDREMFEEKMAYFMSRSPLKDIAIRADTVCVMPVSEGSAIIRRQRDVLQGALPDWLESKLSEMVEDGRMTKEMADEILGARNGEAREEQD